MYKIGFERMVERIILFGIKRVFDWIYVFAGAVPLLPPMLLIK